jgi:hypothetical protein
MKDREARADVDETMQRLPAASKAADGSLRRGQGERHEQDERGEPHRDERALDDVSDDPPSRRMEWSDTTDSIAGGAGIGLFLLHAARSFDGGDSREAATLAGRRLVSLARYEASGAS